MKSIEDTLKLVNNIVRDLRKTVDIDIALVGGYAVISHGVGRTTMDVDFLLYSGYIQESSSKFVDLFNRAVPPGFELKWDRAVVRLAGHYSKTVRGCMLRMPYAFRFFFFACSREFSISSFSK